MITITGGKLTTWRRMAKMAVDRLVEREAREAPVPHARDPARAGRRPGRRCRGSRACPRTLRGRWPAATATRPTTCCASPPSAASSPSRSCRGLPDLLAEAVFAARREQARSAADVLLRRTRLGLLAARELTAPTAERAERVAAALGAERGWDEAARDGRGAALPRRSARAAPRAARRRAGAGGGRRPRRSRSVTFRPLPGWNPSCARASSSCCWRLRRC